MNKTVTAAEKLYSDYKNEYFAAERAKDSLANPPSIDSLRINKLRFERESKFQKRAKVLLGVIATNEQAKVDYHTDRLQENITNATAFTKNSADELHEAAVEIARSHGVDIVVEQSAHADENIEVRMTKEV